MEAARGPILFRCDGTFEKGWEPFYQCLSLAAASSPFHPSKSRQAPQMLQAMLRGDLQGHR